MNATTLTMGPYTVRIGLRRDNPAFPVYLVYLGERFIGRSFSMPDQGCCRWLEHQIYAGTSAPEKRMALRGVAKPKTTA